MGGGIKINGSDVPAEDINTPADGCSPAEALSNVTYASIMAYKER